MCFYVYMGVNAQGRAWKRERGGGREYWQWLHWLEVKIIGRDLTTDIDFGRIDSQTRPVKILVTANPSVRRSALDCELWHIKTSHYCKHAKKVKDNREAKWSIKDSYLRK